MFQKEVHRFVFSRGIHRRPLLAVCVVVLLFWGATLWGGFFSGIVVPLLKFLSLGILAVVIIPSVLGLPFGKVAFPRYASGIYLKISERTGRQIFLGVVTGAMLVGSLALSNLLISGLQITDLWANWQAVDAYHILDGIVHGLWEEVFFRGIVLVLCLRLGRNQFTGIALAAGVFALLHLNVLHLLRLFCMSLLWIVMVLEAESLLPAVVSHIVYDVFFVVFPPQVVGGQVFRWLFLWQVVVALVCLVGIVLTKRVFRYRGAKRQVSYLPGK